MLLRPGHLPSSSFHFILAPIIHTALIALLISICALTGLVSADELRLITILPVARDNTKIMHVAPVGDFNNDGYDDLGVTVRQGWPNVYEAVRLYWGGPAFDSIPDLVLGAEPQGIGCQDPYNAVTGFGNRLRGIGDFNGDGYEDLAVSASGYCEGAIGDGRLYIYLGSPAPDTVPDIIVTGPRYKSFIGTDVVAGDFNCDGLGDILATCRGTWYGAQVYIFLGSDPPDSAYDWLYDYTYQGIMLSEHAAGGADITGDGCTDFSWYYFDPDSGFVSPVFLGGNPLPLVPADTLNLPVPSFPGDISLDGIEDFIIYTEQGPQLCLGGSPLNLDPDYPMGAGFGFNPFIYHLAANNAKLLIDRDWPSLRRIELYNLGVPFDTIPCASFDYNFTHGPGEVRIGDVTGDGTDELAMSDSAGRWVGIYTISTTGVTENDSSRLSGNSNILSVFPNPFNSATMITYHGDLGKGGEAKIEIFDITGKLVKAICPVGSTRDGFEVIWDATGTRGHKMSSGIYFARVAKSRETAVVKLLFLK